MRRLKISAALESDSLECKPRCDVKPVAVSMYNDVTPVLHELFVAEGKCC